MTTLEIITAFSIIILIFVVPYAIVEYKYRKEIKKLYKEYIEESEKLKKLYEKFENEEV